MSAAEEIHHIVRRAAGGERLTRDEIVRLLQVESNSSAEREFMEAARTLVREHLGPKGRLWCAIGLDYKPCAMNCRFCSLAADWIPAHGESELEDDEVLKWAEFFLENGADFLILRTGEDYEVEHLCRLGRAIRDSNPKDFCLAANTRELSPAQAASLCEAGFQGIYKTVRLREGIDTRFDPDKRVRTICRMREAGLAVYSLVEPIGPEHSYEEIAERMILLRDRLRPALIGAMARVPVATTPLGPLGRISDEELAKITAVTIVALVPHIEHVQVVCSHPPSEALMQAGVNAVVVEVGAIPRDRHFASKEWQRFTMEDAKGLLTSAGWEI